jgi:uracil-DNA glycosylase
LRRHGYDPDQLESVIDDIFGDTQHGIVLPNRADVFRAFHLTPPRNVRVVILGQDPYPQPQQRAHGLAFSVPKGVKIPRSLNAIFKNLEADQDIEFHRPLHGDLTSWAQQGVLLLNTALTVRAGVPGSDKAIWTDFTDRVLHGINEECDHIAFLLWGRHAIDQAAVIRIRAQHLVVMTSHPAAWGRTSHPRFKESRPFFEANAYLTLRHPQGPVTWDLTTGV